MTPSEDVAQVSRYADLYRAWLSRHGIDPDTGRMTEAGLALFKACIEGASLRRAERMSDVRHR